MNLFSKVTSFFTQPKSSYDNGEDIINKALIEDKKVVGVRGVFKKINHKGLVYGGSISNRTTNLNHKPPEYDLNQIAAIIDIDSYFRRTVEKYVELILKNGFDFVGKNINTVKYIKKRFEQISEVTDIPLEQLFEDICQQLVTYSNCFISKVRNEKASGGRKRTTFWGKELKPIAGYFVEDATSMMIAKNENGKVLGYKQYIPGASESPEWNPDDMIHIYYSRKRGLSFGTPLCYPVIDDIKALRKMEQNIEILSHQHTIPIIHYKVGTDDHPADPSEVIAVKSELESNPPYGCIVTNERHVIEGVNININAEGIDKLAEVFKMRVYAGLGVSPLVMGEGAGAGRQTAESLDRQMENTAEKFMKVIKTFVNEFMLKELLLEGNYKYDAYDAKNKVELFFPPINQEAKNKVEEHLNNLYQGNLVTETEARLAMGRDPLTETQRKDTHLHHNQIPLAIISAVDEQYQEVTTKSPSGAMKKVKKPVNSNSPAQNVKNKIVNRAQPANQHGKSLARPRITKDNLLKNKVTVHYNATADDIIMSLDDGSFDYGINPIIKTSKKLIKENFKDFIISTYSDGYKSIKNEKFINFNDNIRYLTSQEDNILNNYFEELEKKVNKSIINSKDSKIKNISIVRGIFNNSRDKIDNIIDNELLKAYNIGIIQAGLDNNINNFKVCTDYCSCVSKDIIIESINDYSKIPPFYKSCNCFITIEDKNE